MTITEKILAAKSGSKVEPGQIIIAKLDGILANN